MLTLLPVLFLLLIALAIFFLRWLERGTGFAWLTAVVLTLITWGGVLWIHWQELPVVELAPWQPFDLEGADQIGFGWDGVSWPLGFGLVSLLVCLLLTAPARMQHRSGPLTWSANLVITSLGLFAVLAVSPMAAVLAWTLLDITELVLILRKADIQKSALQTVAAFSVRIGGTLLMLWAMIQAHSAGLGLTYTNIPESSGIFLLLAAGLRLGVLPLNLPNPAELPLQRGLATNLRMTAQVSSLAVLARLPAGVISDSWAQVLMILTALVTFYGAVMWATAEDEASGRQYWSLTLAGFAFAATLRGNSQAVLTWGVVLMISGSMITFYTARSKGLVFLPVLGLLGLVGLPYTPAAAGVSGFVSSPFHVWDIVFLLNLAILNAGYLRLSLLSADSLNELERWMLGVYPLGLIWPVISGWLIAILSRPGGLTAGNWWASLVSFLLALPAFWYLRFVKLSPQGAHFAGGKIQKAVSVFKSAVSPVLTLSWLIRFLRFLFRGLQRLIDLITRMLEGEGGVLWALLLVLLLLTVLAGGGFFQ